MSNKTVIFIDLETDRLDPVTANPIQIAAIACDRKNLAEIETLEMKVQFDVVTASKEALERNHFDPAVWEREAVPVNDAVLRLAAFFKKHATMERVSKKPPFRPYTIAELAGHNIVLYDAVVIDNWFKRAGAFCPAACYTSGPIDTMQMARCVAFAFDEDWDAFNLDALCKRFGVVNAQAHDALADVRATIKIAFALRDMVMEF